MLLPLEKEFKWKEMGQRSYPGGMRSRERKPLSKIKNFGPVTREEFRAMGIEYLDQIEKLGFEETCRRWVESFPERLNANAFLGVICALEGTVWTQATPGQRAVAKELAAVMRREAGK